MKYMNKKGFTLIELLAIIVILAIIMAIAIPQVLNVVNGSKDSAWKDNVKMISKAIELNTQMFDPETGGYTYTVENLCKNPNNVNKISKSTDTTVTCSSNVFTINGTGQFEGKIATIDCSRGNCTTNFTKGGEVLIPEPISFATDSWETIVANVKAGNTSVYAPTANGIDNQVLREVDLGNLGKHYLRVANTTPCTNGETSETACGFVIEFADIISKQQMNATGTNVGGYPASLMFDYVTNTVYNALPEEIRNSIIDTTVVSGHGQTAGESNFTIQNQKLYLLSLEEVFGDKSKYDTAASTTRKLDYYRLKNPVRIKKYQERADYWWLRTAYSNALSGFYCVHFLDDYVYENSTYAVGVSPAFRIG